MLLQPTLDASHFHDFSMDHDIGQANASKSKQQ
jgi:hypothetical protein